MNSNNLTKQLTYSEAKLKIESWCAYQERCQFEVNQKLITFGLNQVERDSLISDLISTNFIDEERFAEAFVSGKFRIKRWGKVKIKMHLKQKFISNYSINKAFTQIEAKDYADTAIALVTKKMKDLKENLSEYEKKGKIHQFLSSKGYEFEVIENALADFLHNNS